MPHRSSSPSIDVRLHESRCWCTDERRIEPGFSCVSLDHRLLSRSTITRAEHLQHACALRFRFKSDRLSWRSAPDRETGNATNNRLHGGREEAGPMNSVSAGLPRSRLNGFRRQLESAGASLNIQGSHVFRFAYPELNQEQTGARSLRRRRQQQQRGRVPENDSVRRRRSSDRKSRGRFG